MILINIYRTCESRSSIPSDSLIEKTKISCEKAARPRAAKHYSKTKGSKLTRAAVIAIPAALMLLVGVLLGAFFIC